MIGEFERVLAALNDAQVRYLVVGGVAVVLHGHLRTTVDLDLVVQLEPDNVRRALDALAGLGYQPRAPVPLHDFADPAKRSAWIHEKNLQVFSMWGPGRPPVEVDLFVEEPFDFEAAWARAVRLALRRTEVVVLSLRDLVELKRRAGRPRDLEDAAALEALAAKDSPPPS